MDIDKTLETLRVRHGAPRSFALRLRPLVERAAASPPEKRERLLAIVERSLHAEAERRTRTGSTSASPELSAVADILHCWAPPEWLLAWEERLRKRNRD